VPGIKASPFISKRFRFVGVAYPIQSPYVSIANRQTEIVMRIASEFGFTPASLRSPYAWRPGSSTGRLFRPNTEAHLLR
jgi:hypothetical protein